MLSAITSLNDSIDLVEIYTVADSSTSDSHACSYLRCIDKANNAQVVPAIMNSDVIENSFSSQPSLNTIILTPERYNVNKLSKKYAATQAAVGGAQRCHMLAVKTL